MTPIQTAAPIARVRAAEGARPEGERLFVDPHAHLFADAAPEVTALFEAIPFFEEHVRLRTRFIDDAVRRALVAGIRDIVLVGAGFDCRALRMPEVAAAGARVIEVDHDSQLAEKRRRLAASGVSLPGHVVHAPADLSVPGELERALRAAGVPPRTRALWVCEGLLGYLSHDELRALAEVTAALSGPGSALVANHNVRSWSAEAVAALFGGAGWRAVPTPSFTELYRTHIGDTPPPGGEDFAVLECVTE